ncbi:MAG: translation initiation factor IF-2, partial [Lachnospiraceae bacterium]|nr:translation initiation factor IF-2 [Lachnospiraceae bacterium]
EEEIKVITIPDHISVKDFAAKLKMQPAALIKKLFLKGQIVTVNDIFDYETAEEIALDMDIICEHEVVVDAIEELLKEEPDPEETLVKRPPVVVVMGHVDHGKTSLLDAIRKTNVIAKEAGGITQHIGAYTVEINGESITFLDTPGHEAFTAMRLRGAQATDVAILVVAADDGVMPQTIEAISHARAAKIHIIVAINKIDKPGANIEKVKQELADQGIVPEEWGGDTIFVPVSAKKGDGIENLLEMVLLDTEILELRANPNRKARGIVIEAKLDKGRGSVATLLVQKGTLKVGDHVAMGESYGKVRAMTNDKGQKIKEAGPSTPVEITGMNGVPNAGDTFVAYDNDKDAKQFAQVFIEENKKKLLAGTKSKKMSLDDVFDQMKAGELKELNLIVKADVQGSVEAIKESMNKLSNDEVVIRVIHSGVGNVSVSDAILASASKAIIIAFNVSANADARDIIEHENVDMRTYSVIYNAIDDVELAMKGMLKPIYEEVITGHVEVRQTFKASGVGIIAGSYVTDGIVKRDSKIRLSRDGEQIYEGSVDTLKRFKDDAKEVRSGYECGIVLKDFQDIKEGDIMEAYEMKEVPRT